MNFCECTEAGFCTRYQREMRGRFREICRGVDVDLGTAAAFREQWRQEAQVGRCAGRPTPLLLLTDQAPGDAVAMTAAIYSLHKAHPGEYLTAVESPHPEVFRYNPDVVPGTGTMLRMHYPAIHQSKERGIHFMQAWCEHLSAALGVPVPLLTNRPHLYFDDPMPLTEDYWVVCSGGKRDFTNKLWGGYQEVVGALSGEVRFVQVGVDQPRLYMRLGTDAVGKTTLRQLFDVVRRARGVLCGVSLLMHVAAALEKPAVVVAGGREPVQWNAYPKQQYVHSVLPCAPCWRSRVVPLGDCEALDRDTCLFPETGYPRCMNAITPSEVAATVWKIDRLLLHEAAAPGCVDAARTPDRRCAPLALPVPK